MTHILIAICIQVCTAMLTGSWLAGACAGMWFFIGREHAQAEYRAIEWFYSGKRANMPWWGGLDLNAWTTKGIMDWLLPSLAVIGVWLFSMGVP